MSVPKATIDEVVELLDGDTEGIEFDGRASAHYITSKVDSRKSRVLAAIYTLYRRDSPAPEERVIRRAGFHHMISEDSKPDSVAELDGYLEAVRSLEERGLINIVDEGLEINSDNEYIRAISDCGKDSHDWVKKVEWKWNQQRTAQERDDEILYSGKIR